MAATHQPAKQVEDKIKIPPLHFPFRKKYGLQDCVTIYHHERGFDGSLCVFII